MQSTYDKKGFTLIELLVVIAVIGILAAVILASLNSSRVKARDSQRKSTLRSLASATELYRSDNSAYLPAAGWFTNPTHGGLDALVPTYISKITDEQAGWTPFMYWRKDYTICGVTLSSEKYGFYAKLENPTASDSATLTDAYDTCVATLYGMNYKVGN
jgi:prepilin-type N-terminal cleavage/methylation domain-containing protein